MNINYATEHLGIHMSRNVLIIIPIHSQGLKYSSVIDNSSNIKLTLYGRVDIQTQHTVNCLYQVEFLVYTSLTDTYAHIFVIHRYYNTLINS